MIDTWAPIFSLSELEKGLCQAQFRRCLTEAGVFYLKDYGVSEDQHRQARETIMHFFEHSSEDEKKSVVNTIPNIRRGYSQLESESTAKITNTGDYADYSINYSMGLSGNLFPSREFEDAITPHFHSFYEVARRTGRQVLNTIGAHCDEDIDSFLECDPVWRFRYFPEVPEHRSAEYQPLRMAPHYDLSIITLIHQTPCPNGFVSLQCELNGADVDIPP